jgi:universal stress protein E
MRRIDRILAVVDPTVETQPAAAKAARIARSCGAALDLFVCDFDPALTGEPFFDTDELRRLRAEFLEERAALVESLASELQAMGVQVDTHVHWDHPLHEGILRHIDAFAPDLVVKDTHHHTLIRRTLITNTDWHLIRSCRAPLLLAHSEPWPAEPLVLAALDPEHTAARPAELDRRLLESAALLAELLGGSLHAVHAFFPASLLAAVGALGGVPILTGDGTLELVQAERRRIGGLLQDLVEPMGLPPERVHVEQGSAVDVLPRIVRQLPAQIVVMGAVSRGRLERAMVGSTAERVLDQLPCDTLIVKPGAFVGGG